MLSPTDNRVLALLRQGPASVQAVGAACFTQPGKRPATGILPAAAHLKRMLSRHLVTRSGRFYSPAKSEQAETLFGKI